MKIHILGFICSVLLFSSCKTSKKINQFEENKSKTINKWIKPPNLIKGDTIALLSPAGYVKGQLEAIQNALDSITSWGLNYKLSKHIFDKKGSFAGDDTSRAIDFQNAIDNPNIKAIWCTRGGYGSVRILDKINFKPLLKNPKWIIGYSDVTALHNQIHNLGLQSIHGIMPLNFKNSSDKKIPAIKSFKNTFFGIKNTYKIKSSPYNKLGTAKGVVVGGNLTLLHTMLGSKTSINTTDKILFIEDIGEYKYHIDRMLYSLKRAGYFDHCKGLIVGGFTHLKINDSPFAKNIEEVITQVLKEYHFPIIFDFPAGHQEDNRTLILGAKVKLSVKKEVSVLKFL